MSGGVSQHWSSRVTDRFHRLDLTAQFVLTGSIVALLAMLAVGSWVSSRIARDAIDGTAAATALYMDSFIAPLAQELADGDELSTGPIRAIEEILLSPALNGRVVSIKIWRKDGMVAYANDLDLIGKHFEPSDSLNAAYSGATIAELDRLDDPESAEEAAKNVPLLEIYSPIRATWSDEIIGVAEFYENASGLVEQISRARLQGWLMTAAATLVIGICLTGIVHRGSRLIAEQRKVLATKVVEAEKMTEQNQHLRLRAERTTRRIAEINELSLKRIGADLHDGVAQLIGLAALRLDAVRGGRTRNKSAALREVADALTSAMEEIRLLSRGLILPELNGLALAECIEHATKRHETRTHTKVSRVIELGNIDAPALVKICVYRFVQEGLNNAFRHGAGKAQNVSAMATGNRIALEIRNAVSLDTKPDSNLSSGLGLPGLRERVESLGGSMLFSLQDNHALLSMELDLDKVPLDD